MELLYEIALFEHPDGGTARVFVGEIKVDERETIKVVRFCGRYGIGDESQGVLVVGGRVVTQALEGHLLLRHQLARGFVHLRIVNTEAAEDSERLEYRHVRVGEGRAVVLQRISFIIVSTYIALNNFILRLLIRDKRISIVIAPVLVSAFFCYYTMNFLL